MRTVDLSPAAEPVPSSSTAGFLEGAVQADPPDVPRPKQAIPETITQPRECSGAVSSDHARKPIFTLRTIGSGLKTWGQEEGRRLSHALPIDRDVKVEGLIEVW